MKAHAVSLTASDADVAPEVPLDGEPPTPSRTSPPLSSLPFLGALAGGKKPPLIERFDELRASLPKLKFVAFDFFDTLIGRHCHPESIKLLWCARIAERFGTGQTGFELYVLRGKLEAELYGEAEQFGQDAEFKLGDLYERFHARLDHDGTLRLPSSAEFSAECERIEVELEATSQHRFEESVALVEYVRSLGLEAFLISDFYMEERMFVSLLRFHDLDRYFSRRFISCEHRKTKRSGALYETVLKTLRAGPDTVLMVGDNPYSDRDRAEERGIRSLWIDRTQIRERDEKRRVFLEGKERFTGALAKLIDTPEAGDVFRALPASLFYFTAELHRRLRRDGVRNVFFLSREGEALKRFFDRYQEVLGFSTPIRSHYLLASRRATFLPSLGPLETETFETLFRQYRHISLREFLLSLNFEPPIIARFEEEFGDAFVVRHADLTVTSELRRLFEMPLFRETYEQSRSEQRENLKFYLDSFGVDFEKEGLTLVDVGWKGTIQDNFRRFLPESVSVSGLYLGLVAAPNVTDTNRKEGLLHSCLGSTQPFSEIYLENTALFEIALGASHGSAERYDIVGGIPTVVTEQQPYERELYVSEIQPRLERIEDRIVRIAKHFRSSPFQPREFERWFAESHARMVLYPSKHEVRFIQSVKHFENFGLFEYTTFERTGRIGIRARVRNFMNLLRHPMTAVRATLWSSVTLSNMGLSFLQRPYGAVRYYRLFLKGSSPRLDRAERVAVASVHRSRSLLRRLGAPV